MVLAVTAAGLPSRPLRAQQTAGAPAVAPTPPPSPLSGAMPRPVLGEAPRPPAAAAPKIVEIVTQGGKTVTPDTIAFYLGVKVGDPYDPSVVQRNFGRLWDSGLFEDLTLEKEDVPGGVKLIAVIVERPTVADLEFRGNKKLTTSQLKDKLKEGKAEIKIGSPVSFAAVSKAKTVLIEAYKSEGFRSASVATSIEPVAENTRRVVFVIDEGDKLKIESIRFTGNTVFGQQTLRNAMDKTAVDHWWRFWDSKSTYNQANYDEDVENLRKLYQNKGYKDVVIKDAVLDVYVANPKETRPEKIKRRVRITIPIVEGDRYYFGTLKVEGSTVFPAARLEGVFEYKPGKPLSYAVLQDGIKVIDESYRRRGYIYAFMNPEFAEKPNHVVDVTIRITEGDQYRLGRMEFSGNKTTRDKVLRREFPINEGDIMDMEIFKKGLQKVTQLGYFKIEEEPDWRVNPDTKTVDVTVKGTDVNRNEVQFGAGYSQPQGFFGQFQFSTRNFLGRGDTLGLQFQRGSSSNFFDVSFTEPYFLDKRMSIGGSVYNRDLQYLDVQSQRTKGVSASLGLGLGLWDVASFFYGFTDYNSQYQVYPPPQPPGGGTPPIAYSTFTGTTSTFTPGYVYNSTNDPFDPSRGMRIGASVALAGGPLGGDYSYVGPAASFTWYIPATRRSNFAFNISAAYLKPYNNTQIPIFLRYRLGGDRSIRGYKYGAIVPVVYKNGRYEAFFDAQGALLGGDKMYYFNIEYVYALAGPLKVALFFDAGNTWIELQPFTPLKLMSSYGVEARIFLPIFQAPLRFIYGINPTAITIYDQRGLPIPNGTQSKSNFTFTIGSTF
jgi:outer membrane protein insertion porin family